MSLNRSQQSPLSSKSETPEQEIIRLKRRVSLLLVQVYQLDKRVLAQSEQMKFKELVLLSHKHYAIAITTLAGFDRNNLMEVWETAVDAAWSIMIKHGHNMSNIRKPKPVNITMPDMSDMSNMLVVNNNGV